MKDNQAVPAYMRIIGQNIKRRRLDLKLSQAALATIMNYSSGHISHIECGKRGMPIDTLLAFCSALDTDCNSLVMDPADIVESVDKDVAEVADMLRGRPVEYINMVKSFILSTDLIMREQQYPTEGAQHRDTGAVLV